jgi:hypothetical protein
MPNHSTIYKQWPQLEDEASTKKMLTANFELRRHQVMRSRWNEMFARRRNLKPEVENQIYVEFIQTQYGCDDTNEEDEDDVDEDEDDDEDKDYEDEDEEIEVAIEQIADKKETEEVEDSDGGEQKAPKTLSKVRLFMKGMGDEESKLKFNDQVELVASFCEQSLMSQTKKRVALLDDRNCQDRKISARTYLGPLTSQELEEQLSRKVIDLTLIFHMGLPKDSQNT